ncbi:MAG: hypothetical protein HQ595_00160, partial [Candidatus Omnitrophica bacterium]|nr:hypothetical protein [Candidatus Omnitrophota bacterium]
MKLFRKFTRWGVHTDFARRFLLFIRKLNRGEEVAITIEDGVIAAAADPNWDVPMLSERDREAINQEGEAEAQACKALIAAKRERISEGHRQFEYVALQEQDDAVAVRRAQQSLSTFLAAERKHLLSSSGMLPCRRWEEILYMLGVASIAQLESRIIRQLVGEEEIFILFNAYLQSRFLLAKATQNQTGVKRWRKINQNTTRILRRVAKEMPHRLEAALAKTLQLWQEAGNPKASNIRAADFVQKFMDRFSSTGPASGVGKPVTTDQAREKAESTLPDDPVAKEEAIKEEILGNELVVDQNRLGYYNEVREEAQAKAFGDVEIIRSLDEMVAIEIRAGPMNNLFGTVRAIKTAQETLHLDEALFLPENRDQLLITLIHEAGMRLGRKDEANERFAQICLEEHAHTKNSYRINNVQCNLKQGFHASPSFFLSAVIIKIFQNSGIKIYICPEVIRELVDFDKFSALLEAKREKLTYRKLSLALQKYADFLLGTDRSMQFTYVSKSELSEKLEPRYVTSLQTLAIKPKGKKDSSYSILVEGGYPVGMLKAIAEYIRDYSKEELLLEAEEAGKRPNEASKLNLSYYKRKLSIFSQEKGLSALGFVGLGMVVPEWALGLLAVVALVILWKSIQSNRDGVQPIRDSVLNPIGTMSSEEARYTFLSLTAEKGQEPQEAAESLLLQMKESLQAQGFKQNSIFKQTFFVRDRTAEKAARDAISKHFGRSPPATSCIPQAPANSAALGLEVLAVKGPNVSVVRVDQNLTVVEQDGVRWDWVADIYPKQGLADTRKQASSAFKQIGQILGRSPAKRKLKRSKLSSIRRTWLYQRDIFRKDDDGNERYSRLNKAREKFFRWIRFSFPPASTGIGITFGNFIMECFAVSSKRKDFRAIALKNRKQTPTTKYAKKVLGAQKTRKKSRPMFERGVTIVIGLFRIIFVSGTAAIENSETMHIGDVVKQTETTIKNIGLVLKDGGASFEDVVQLRVYIKNKEDVKAVQKVVEAKFPGIPREDLIADVCRENLLVEIEAIAVSSKSVSSSRPKVVILVPKE